MEVIPLLLSLLVAISNAQVLVFNSNQRDSCISSPCDITDAALWIPSISPSPTTSLLITTPSVSLFLNISLSVQNVTLSNNSNLSLTGTGQVSFQNLVLESSNFSSSAAFTTESLHLSGDSQVQFLEQVTINSSFVAQSTSISYFGGGFGPDTIPFMAISANATVTAERLLNVKDLTLSDQGMLNLVGGGYTTVAQLSGNGKISLHGSQIYIGESIFDGLINGTQGSTIFLSNFVVNGSLLTDSTSSLQISEEGIRLFAPAALHGGFANSAKLSISPSGSLFISGILDLKAKSFLEFDSYFYSENSPSPIVVNGSASLNGNISVNLAGWTYNGNQTIKMPLLLANKISGMFSYVDTPNTSVIPNRNPNATEIFYLNVAEQTVYLVYGTPPASSHSPSFFKKHWKIIAEVGAGGVAFLSFVVIITCVVTKRSRKGKKKSDEVQDSLLRTDNSD